MPGLSGQNCPLSADRPAPICRSVILSGYNSKLNEEALADLDVSAYFSKPLDNRELSQAVRQSLDR